jgi:hypothetical protein
MTVVALTLAVALAFTDKSKANCHPRFVILSEQSELKHLMSFLLLPLLLSLPLLLLLLLLLLHLLFFLSFLKGLCC